MSNPPNYFEDFDESKADLLEDKEEEKYDDDETFGDSGPLTNEWEAQRDLVSEERERFLQNNKFDRKHIEEDINYADEEDDEDNFGTFGSDNKYNNNNNNNSRNGNSSNHFFSSTTTTTTTTTSQHQQQFSQSTRKVTGVFNSLSLEDDNNQIDEESVFKIAMGESAFDSLTQLQPTLLPKQQQQPINPLQKLMSIIPQESIQHNHANENEIKSRFSVSDLESKYINQPTSSNEDQEDQLITPSKLNKQQVQGQTTSGEYSPSKQQFYKNKYSRPPPITLGDMVNNNNSNNNNQINQNNNQNNSPQHQHQHQPSNSPNKFKSPNKHKINNNNPNKNNLNIHNNNNNSNNSGDKKYMTAEEIQSIIRLQSYQIHFTNPYIEDYYFQRFKMKSQVPTHTHTPICDSQPKTAPQKKPFTPNTVDPLSGALGRIPSHSIRAPRQILQIILSGSEGEGQTNADGKPQQNSDQTIKLVVESAYSHVLDLEDLNILISLNQDQQLLQEYIMKRDLVSTNLFQSLHLDPFPSFKFESPQLPPQEPNQKWPSVCPEDLLFVSLWVLSKGRKLLNRSFPLLSLNQSLSGLFAVCRNLPLLLLLHRPEGSELSTEGIYATVVKWIMEVPIKFFILGFHFLVNFNQGKFLSKLMTDSKEGRSVVHAFLARGTLIQDPNYRAKSGFNVEMIDNEQWRDVFDRFFQRLTGSFISIFPPTNNPSMELSQLFSFIFANSNDKQRQTIQLELSGGSR